MSRWPPVAELLPHAPPMLALEELVDWSPGFAVARLTVRADGPFVRAGAVAGVCMLEFMAQAVAACLGHEARTAGEAVRAGMVIACRSLVIERPFVPVGTALILRARRVRGSRSVSLFETEAEAPDGLVARATMTLFHGGEPPQDGQDARDEPTIR